MKSKTLGDTDENTVIGVEIGKGTFHLVGFDHAGVRARIRLG